MKRIRLAGETHELPTSWNELTVEQLLHLNTLINLHTEAAAVRARMLVFCMGGTLHPHPYVRKSGVYMLRKGSSMSQVSFNELFDASEAAFHWLHKDGTLMPGLTKNPFPTMTCGNCTLKVQVEGPEDCLNDITFGQFGLLQTYIHGLKGDYTNMLDWACATIYRGKGTDYNVNNIKTMSVVLSAFPKAQKEVVLLFVYGCINFIVEKFPRIFSVGSNKVIQKVVNPYEQHMEVVCALAPTAYEVERIQYANLYDVLYKIDSNLRESEQFKKDMEDSKAKMRSRK